MLIPNVPVISPKIASAFDEEQDAIYAKPIFLP
jgi:hypothetical protein